MCSHLNFIAGVGGEGGEEEAGRVRAHEVLLFDSSTEDSGLYSVVCEGATVCRTGSGGLWVRAENITLSCVISSI